jgi:hypothetical protein
VEAGDRIMFRATKARTGHCIEVSVELWRKSITRVKYPELGDVYRVYYCGQRLNRDSNDWIW